MSVFWLFLLWSRTLPHFNQRASTPTPLPPANRTFEYSLDPDLDLDASCRPCKENQVARNLRNRDSCNPAFIMLCKLNAVACYLAAVASLATLGHAAPSGDLVSSLPSLEGELPSKLYSGFLDVEGTTKRLHYLFAESQGSPAEDPVVLWLNGGPGCSSLEGFFYEHGSVIVSDAHAPPNANFDGSDSSNANSSHTLVHNEWTWSKSANVIYLEAPAGVGFSYDAASGAGSTQPTAGDNSTAADNLAALDAFFTKFPEYQKNEFYVSGESYGGVYVPTLSLKILQAGSAFKGNMAGYLVGNGVFDWEDAQPTHIEMAAGHGFVSAPFAAEAQSTCEASNFTGGACKKLLSKIQSKYVDSNGYDDFRTCFQPNGDVGKHGHFFANLYDAYAATSEGRFTSLQRLAMTRKRRSLDDVPCINSIKGTEYLHRSDVRAALHVDVSPNKWEVWYVPCASSRLSSRLPNSRTSRSHVLSLGRSVAQRRGQLQGRRCVLINGCGSSRYLQPEEKRTRSHLQWRCGTCRVYRRGSARLPNSRNSRSHARSGPGLQLQVGRALRSQVWPRFARRGYRLDALDIFVGLFQESESGECGMAG